ncbi:MAG TPA: zinc ribbon domain-containing protein [Nitrospira sp.]|nr:zinc ribbon domain-containing protein [Nitrospira sp.]
MLSGLAKCVICGGSIVACKNVSKRSTRRGSYQCALNHKRGTAICSNNVRLGLDVLDSAILHALNDAIDERVLETSVLTALNRIRAKQDSFPNQRLAIQRELSLIEARCRRLLDLMGDGKGNPLMVKELDGLAARQAQLQQELQRLEAQTQVVHLDAKRLAQDLRRRLSDLPSLFGRHVPQARQMLRKVLDGHILCEPILEDGKPGYRFSATGTFDRLLTGKRVMNGRTNDRGCGERI